MSDIEAALRELVRLRAAGPCEYCGISERIALIEHEIDHVIAVKHGGKTVADNLALCCAICNRFKGSDIASIDSETGQLTALFNLRVDHRRDSRDERAQEASRGVGTRHARVRAPRSLPHASSPEKIPHMIFGCSSRYEKYR